MSKYVVLLPGDENVWEATSPEHKSDVYGKHAEFAKALEERGHKVVGGAELAHSRQAKQVRTNPGGGVIVTDGPYAETVEQLTGFYLIETDDLDDLLETCGILADVESAIEVREMLTGDDNGGDA
jgi:hypothetical protein